jgi:nucleoside-triphosphatase
MTNGVPRRITLCTGKPGVGKSTLVRAVAEALGPDRVSGFISCEIRESGRRQGFGVQVLGGASGLLAGPDVVSDIRFGSLAANGHPRLGVTHTFLDDVACPVATASRAPLLVVDEIGPMQATSPPFREMIESVLAGQRRLLGTIATADDPWLSKIRDHEDVAVIELTKANRDVLRVALTSYYRLELKGQLD